jgi:hypothetical protein
MSKKLLSIFALLFFINFINSDSKTDRYQEALESVTSEIKTAQETGQEPYNALFETYEGKLYLESFYNSKECKEQMWETGQTASTTCDKYRKKVTKNYKKLQNTPEYAEFLPYQRNMFYYRLLKKGLNSILKFSNKYKDHKYEHPAQNYEFTKYRRDELKDIINAQYTSPPAEAENFLDRPKDIDEIDARAKKELHKIVSVVEYSDNTPEIRPLDITYEIPEYDLYGNVYKK